MGGGAMGGWVGERGRGWWEEEEGHPHALTHHYPSQSLLLSSKFVKRTPIYGHKINQAASLRKKTTRGCQERKTKMQCLVGTGYH